MYQHGTKTQPKLNKQSIRTSTPFELGIGPEYSCDMAGDGPRRRTFDGDDYDPQLESVKKRRIYNSRRTKADRNAENKKRSIAKIKAQNEKRSKAKIKAENEKRSKAKIKDQNKKRSKSKIKAENKKRSKAKRKLKTKNGL